MPNVIIRHRLVTWFEEFEDHLAPNGTNRREMLSSMGDEVDMPQDEYERLLRVNTTYDPPFYTEEQADAIRAGTYRGHDAATLSRFRAGQPVAVPQIEALSEGEGPDIRNMDIDALADYIKDNRLTASQVVGLVGEDATSEDINKVLDAEGLALDNSPRATVTGPLERKLNATIQREAAEGAQA